MTTVQEPFAAKDEPAIASLRAATAPQRGKIFGPAARGPLNAMKQGVAAALEVRMEPGSVGGVAGWWCRPENARTDAQILYFHGGCFSLGTAEAFRNQVSHYAHHARADTFSADYRLAPEHPFPAAFDDAWSVYEGMAASGATKIGLAGDSAGGALALYVLQAAAAQAAKGILQPCGAAVMSPWIDLALTGDSMKTRAETDPIFTPKVLAAFVADFLQGVDPLDSKASPLLGEYGGLPPIRIDVGDAEILLDDSTRFAKRAVDAGVEVTLAIWAGMPHSFQAAVGRLDAADKAMAAAGKFLADRFDV